MVSNGSIAAALTVVFLLSNALVVIVTVLSITLSPFCAYQVDQSPAARNVGYATSE